MQAYSVGFSVTATRSTITLDMPPPALVVEVVSPGKANEDRDYRYKRSEYAARGIAEYWIVDPQINAVRDFQKINAVRDFQKINYAIINNDNHFKGVMKVQHPLFSQVALTQDLPEYNLKRGNVATIVEHYPMPEGEEDGYSLEGFDLPHVTIEVPASQIIPLAQWQQEEMILAKLRQLSGARLLQLQDYLDFLLQKQESEHQSA